MVRLTVSVDPPPPTLVSVFCDFLTLYYDEMFSETDFTPETSHFHPTTRIPNSPVKYPFF